MSETAGYRSLAIQRITYTHDEYGTRKLSVALGVVQDALAEAANALASQARTIEALRAAVEAARPYVDEHASSSLDGISVLAQIDHALKEHPNG